MVVEFVAREVHFEKTFAKLDSAQKDKIKTQIRKIIENPEVGKPMRFARRGTREVYIGSFRLSYAYNQDESKIILLELYHKNQQ